ncbi:MAG: hypothetical protein R8G34_20950 [Paracoccaceae bacterium]|nr:hypothetical protein [Paracoccaceae bacterium]
MKPKPRQQKTSNLERFFPDVARKTLLVTKATLKALQGTTSLLLFASPLRDACRPLSNLACLAGSRSKT